MGSICIRSVLLIVAVVCFAVVAIGLKVSVDLLALGLAFFAAAFLVGDAGWGRRG